MHKAGTEKTHMKTEGKRREGKCAVRKKKGNMEGSGRC